MKLKDKEFITLEDVLEHEFNSYLDHQKEIGQITKWVFFEMTANNQKRFYNAWKRLHLARQEMYGLIEKEKVRIAKLQRAKESESTK